MKRKNLILTALTFVVVALGALNLGISNKQKAAEVFLANIEATASGEGYMDYRESHTLECSTYKLEGFDEKEFRYVTSYTDIMPENIDELRNNGWLISLVLGTKDDCRFEGAGGCLAHSCGETNV